MAQRLKSEEAPVEGLSNDPIYKETPLSSECLLLPQFDTNNNGNWY